MAMAYGFVKCRVAGRSHFAATRAGRELQYHLRVPLEVETAEGPRRWEAAVNVGTDDADDPLRYRLVFDFEHPLVHLLAEAEPGLHLLTDAGELPALDFLRSDVLAGTGRWRESDLMDGDPEREPAYSLRRLFEQALLHRWSVCIYGRLYSSGYGVHDVHMNQGSGGDYAQRERGSRGSNAVWQDGAVLVEREKGRWAAYFAAFTQQALRTDARGDPADNVRALFGPSEGTLGDRSRGV